MYFIGTDVGTTGTKTIVTDENGEILGKGYQEYELITGFGGRVEQNAEDWWNAVLYSVKEAIKNIPDKHNIKALSLSTQGGSTLAVDSDFNPVSPAYTWMDERSEKESNEIADQYTQYIYRTSGWRCDPCFDPPKMRWLAVHEPEIFQKAAYFVSTIEFVNFRLTGSNVIDPSNAAMRQLVNVNTSDWDPQLLEIAGLSPRRLPQCLPTGKYIGNLTVEAALLLELPASVEIYNGAHDQYCASIGSGAVTPGDMLLSTGTTWVILGITDQPLFTPSHIAPGVHPISGLYGNIASLCSAGSALKWFKQLTGESFEAMDAEASGRMRSAEKILFYPYYAGSGFPHHLSKVKACCIGMELMHDKYDLARALMEGISFETRASLEEFARYGADIRKLKMVGGAAKSDLWVKLTADITGCEIQIPAEKDTCCIGAAIIAAVGSGMYASYEEAARKMLRYSITVQPEPATAEFYHKKYEKYTKNFASIKECF